MDDVVELGALWHVDAEHRRVRRALAELARILAVARAEGGEEGVRRRWGELVDGFLFRDRLGRPPCATFEMT